MVHIIELVGQPKVEFAQQVTMNRALQLKPAENESRSAIGLRSIETKAFN
ncbi:uncharacterized protein LOC6605599 isoform X30 [Drosophila sechellia]|uniref:Bruno 3, isoform J n=2 Tax=melanogaster subgroup TaxID=32351 RepID=M9MRV0_DROME|nr:bruno 3, isoform J [Drosophila melanogaster]XP_032573307.1 uncharacterized protein LOC6605599 isoform X30 [Drosophila sechellia]XP_039148913.1 uncharacterized protein LOC6737975 isoform X14 [Drosophila simulans]XP_039485469.1 uncharacterized protein LOC120447893 isoform X27 [Drosophila santomea]ADV37533.1 bruno 3, isoform J [Drosophila melanogaster]KMY99428.1 bruno-3, isoform E [Drosophila simulans]|eukprot:NP_001189097.1 bruno 3, isoform J [Drosophila melanogaster]